MRTIVSVISAAVLLLGAGFAQQPADPKFKSETRLVLVPAVVKDKSGNHVGGLTKDQFKLTQDGKDQPIGVFEEVKVSRSRLESVQTVLPAFSNEVTDIGRPRALTVIAFDVINTPVFAMTQVKQDLLKYLGQMAERGEPTALVSLEPGRARVIYDFTADPRAIAAALGKIQSRPLAGQTSAELNNARPYLVNNVPDVNVISAESFAVLEQQLSTWVNQKLNADAAQRIQARQTRRDTLEALRRLASALKSFPGRKTLIWVTGGFPYAEETTTLQLPTSNARRTEAPKTPPPQGSPSQGTTQPAPDFTQMDAQASVGMTGPEITHSAASSEALNDHTRTWGMLNDANVAVYPIDARRLVNTAFDTINVEQKYSAQATDRTLAYGNAEEVITTFENMAQATGGKPCYGRADLSKCFKEAIDDGDSYYMLGYYVPDKTKPGWHKLQVKASSKDTSIRTRSGFMYSDVPLGSRPAIQEDIAYAVASPMNAIAVPFHGSFTGSLDRNGKKAMQFLLNLPLRSFTVDQQNGNHIALDVAAVAFGADGKPAGTMGQTIDTKLNPEALAKIQQGGLSYKNVLELAPGDYQVRFVVRDNLTGHLGSVMTNLKVQ